MSTRLRWYRPNRIYEITTRTIQERFLLRPSAHCRALVLGVIARALQHYPAVNVYAFTFLSNHYHLLASATDGWSLVPFVNYVNGNVARELGRLHGWDGRFWQRRASAIEVVDDAAVIARLRYVVSQGVKEGLVSRATDWTGASTVPAHIGAARLEGLWIDRDRETRATRRGRTLDPAEYRIIIPIKLTPIPPWAHLGAAALVAKHRALVADVEHEAAHARTGTPLGIRAVEAQDPHGQPSRPKRGPAPLCHATTSAARVTFRTIYRAFVSAFRCAAESIRETSHQLFPAFPHGSCPRPATYIPHPLEVTGAHLPPIVVSVPPDLLAIPRSQLPSTPFR